MTTGDLKFQHLQFEGSTLVSVHGMRPEYMTGNSLIRLVKGLGRLLLIERSGAKKVAQRNEIARLTAEVEQLKSDKANLLFDLNKERAGTRIKGEAK